MAALLFGTATTFAQGFRGPYGMALHEILMAGHQRQDARFFFRAAKALEGDAADMAREFLVKNQLKNLGFTVF